MFGLDLARQKIVETRTAAVVEGYTDVVMAHQFGVSNVVSVLGTALTEHHVTMLRRFADRIVLLFDADRAGRSRGQPGGGVVPDPAGGDRDRVAAAREWTRTSFCWPARRPRRLTRCLPRRPMRCPINGSNWFADVKARRRRDRPAAGGAAVSGNAGGGTRIGAGGPDSLGAALARVSRLTEIPVEELNRRFRLRPAERVCPARQAVQVGEPNQPKSSAQASAVDRSPAGRRIYSGTFAVRTRPLARIQQHVQPDDFTDEALRKIAEVFWRHQQDEPEAGIQ